LACAAGAAASIRARTAKLRTKVFVINVFMNGMACSVLSVGGALRGLPGTAAAVVFRDIMA
jgi:hypothetical protein